MLSLIAPSAAGAVPGVSAVPEAAGPPALTAWTTGRDVRVATPDGVARTVARLGPNAAGARLTLDRQGRRLAVGTGDALRVLDVTTGAPLQRLAPIEGRVSWSPDGASLIVTGEDVVRCDLARPTPCRTVDRDADDDETATWAPDGRAFAYSSRKQGKARSDFAIVVVGAAGRRVVERYRTDRRGADLPTAPLWSADGLTWARLTLPLRPGSALEDLETLSARVRTRRLQADGRIRTISAGTYGRGSVSGAIPLADTPGGRALVGTVQQRRAERSTLRLGLLGAGNAFAPTWSRTIADDAPESDLTVAGVLADGRVVLRFPTPEGEAGHLDLRVLDGPTGLGRLIARGGSATIAAAFPGTGYGGD